MDAQQAVNEILDEYEAGKRKPYTVQHTADCDERQARYEQDIAAYVAKWPDYCQKCGGAGGFNYPSSYHEPPDYELCECLEQDICPRCGKRTIVWLVTHSWEQLADLPQGYGDTPFCCSCGWIDGFENSTPPAPEPHECWCWEQDAIEAERQIYERGY